MEELQKQISEIVKVIFGAVDVAVVVTPTVGQKFADGREVEFSSNIAMQLAGRVGQAPREIAELIAARVSGFETEVAGPGFLNFISSDEYYLQKLGEFGKNFTKNISCSEYNGQTVICEFSDPNPFKVLHVGHLYTSIVGDSISRLLEFAGGKVVRANFGGDVGLHVAKTLYALKKRGFTETKNPEEAANLLAECYVEGTRVYEEDEGARAEIDQLNREIYKIVTEDIHEGELAEMYWWGREASYAYFEEFYARVGLKFDKFYPESSVAELGLAQVRKELIRGIYEESDGAVIFPGEKYGLHTRVFINKNGVPTYETKDVGLIFQKDKDYHFDKSIVITANEQYEYMRVVWKSVSLYAPELIERSQHLTHGMVKLPGSVKMSSRLGNFLRAVDVISAVRESLRENSEGLDAKDFEKVAMGAIKYAFLKYKMGGDIVFDIAESVSTTGNSGPYLQYSAVRAKKILGELMKKNFSGSRPSGPSSRADGAMPRQQPAGFSEKSFSLNSSERTLVRKMSCYKSVLSESVEELAPHKVCTYLYELAQEFSRFYENVKVVGSEYEKERGEIVMAYLKVMTHGLGLLGIEVPERM